MCTYWYKNVMKSLHSSIVHFNLNYSPECNKMLEELEKRRTELKARLGAIYDIDEMNTILVKIKDKQLDRSTLMR